MRKACTILSFGVTEAGEGEDGRIKSAAGIGTLLEDGIGDTIRVSLTEDPEFEVPVATMLVNRYEGQGKAQPYSTSNPLTYSPLEYKKHETHETFNIGGKNHPRIIADFSDKKEAITPAMLFGIGYSYNTNTGKWKINDQAADYIFTGDNVISFTLPQGLSAIYNYNTWKENKQSGAYPYFNNIEAYGQR